MSPHGNLSEHLVECLNVICGRLLREGDKLDHPGAIGARYPRKAEVMPAPRWWEKGYKSRVGEFGRMDGELPTGILTDEMDFNMVAAIVTGLWIAVGWHRFVLLGERASLVPVFRGDRMWAYFLYSLGYGLILILIGAIWGGIVGFVIVGLLGNSVGLAVLLMSSGT